VGRPTGQLIDGAFQQLRATLARHYGCRIESLLELHLGEHSITQCGVFVFFNHAHFLWEILYLVFAPIKDNLTNC
jgi:hypothetical protein